MSAFKIIGIVKYRYNNDPSTDTFNMVVEDGRIEVVNAIAGDPANMPQYIAVGSDGTGETSTDSELGSELDRKPASISKNTTSIDFDVIFYPGEATGDIREVGLLSDDVGGTLFARTTITDRIKGPNDRLDITWTIMVVDASS